MDVIYIKTRVNGQRLISLSGPYCHKTVGLWLGMHPTLGVVYIPMAGKSRRLGFDFVSDPLTYR